MVEGKLQSSVAANNMQLCSAPFVARQSPISGFCNVFFQVWDSSTSINLHMLIGQKFIWSGAIVEISEAKARSGVPQCPRCWQWGHTTLVGSRCLYQNVQCPRCSSPHALKDHRILAECCKAKPNAKPNPLPATPAGEPCPHTPHCVNCGGPHASDARECPFFKHRMDREWIIRSYQAIEVSGLRATFSTRTDNNRSPRRNAADASNEATAAAGAPVNK